MPRLIELLANIEFSSAAPINPEIEITGITANSANVKDGYIFFALKGEKTDGANFIPNAVKNGASVIISDDLINPATTNHQPPSTIHLTTPNPRLAFARIAANFYGQQPEHLVAITGTDGKTSTADFFRQLMFLCGKKSASMGTIGALAGDGSFLKEGTLTTPFPDDLHKYLAQFAGSGITHLAMEASSHGLSQYRLDGVKLEAAAFTNIARDHLDFHKTEEAYFTAKSRLFSELLPVGKTAVLNADDARFPELKAICNSRGQQIIDFGKNAEKFYIRALTPHGSGQSVLLTLFGKKYNVEVPLVGAFQVMNILAALGLAVGVGCELEEVLARIPQLKGVSGRLEHVATLKNGASIYIDYAHTPLALANILTTMRPHTVGKLAVIFGCGGDRDAGKRPLMGKAAAELADIAIITDDNPRSENPATIRSEVMAGVNNTPNGKAKCKEVADRHKAIYSALTQLSAGDVLVIAGKGHEKTQIIGSEHLPFDDAVVARACAQELGLLA